MAAASHFTVAASRNPATFLTFLPRVSARNAPQSDIPMPVATWVMDDVLYRTGGFHCGFG
jgi:hypothetical protein